MLILNSCPEQSVCVRAHACASARLPGQVPAVPKGPPQSILLGVEDVGEQPQGHHGQQRGHDLGRDFGGVQRSDLWMENAEEGQGNSFFFFESPKNKEKVKGAHHGKSVEEDVDKFRSTWVGQRSIQQALGYLLENQMC